MVLIDEVSPELVRVMIGDTPVSVHHSYIRDNQNRAAIRIEINFDKLLNRDRLNPETRLLIDRFSLRDGLTPFLFLCVYCKSFVQMPPLHMIAKCEIRMDYVPEHMAVSIFTIATHYVSMELNKINIAVGQGEIVGRLYEMLVFSVRK